MNFRATQIRTPSFGAACERHRPRVRAVAWRLTRDATVAEELAHESFVRLHASMALFRQQAALSTWLYRTVVNLCHDHARTAGRSRAMVSLDDDALPTSEALAPDLSAEASERTRLLDAAVHSLAPPMRDAVVLRFVSGLGYDEIAEVLGCPPGTVASRIHRALRLVGAMLAAQGIQEDSL